jgi:hypothetical protein
MGRKRKPKKPKQKPARKQTEAQRADVYQLYEEAVQDPPTDIALVERIYRSHFGRAPHRLREDFCGTAAMACCWVTRHPKNRAWGIDLDPEPLAWGREHHVAPLSPDQADRLVLLRGDVLDTEHEPVDITVAFNFSYFVFRERAQLVGYFEKSRARLNPQGMLVLDLYGGAEAQRTQTETREYDGFDYVWDQDVFDPIQHHAVNHIHFEFEDGSRIERAFTYEWRLWTIPELCDALGDAGFSKTEVYWEQTDRKTNEGNGVYYRARRADDDPAWVSYIVALR